MPAGPMSRDPKYYDEPDVFNSLRFYSSSKRGDGPDQSPEHEFTGIEPGNVVWGNGRLTCPGRWYASAMNKLIVASLLLRYDISYPDGQSSRPPNTYKDGAILPSPTQNLLFRCRS